LSRTIKVSRTARYETLGPEDGTAHEVWFVLHGYGQLASSFIKVFASLDDGTRLIAAPEALNRFYLANVETTPAADRPVGATWMTREDRDNEIADYVAYLDAVAREVLGVVRQPPRVVLLGFSQGVATAARWITSGSIRPAHFIMWGGFLPPELDTPERAHPLMGADMVLLIGTQDRFVGGERLAEEAARMRAVGVSHRLVRYDGGHGISHAALRELAAAIAAPNAAR
jgi:predicted esterase